MGENEQGGSLRTVIVIALIAMLGLVITTAAVSMASKVKGEHQNTSSLVNKHLSETNDSIKVKTDTEDNTIFKWRYDKKTHTATVLGFISGKEVQDVVIPKYKVLNGEKYLVNTIESNAFRSGNIASVTFPDSLVSIQENAFSYNKLVTVNIPKSVKYIEDNAFSYNQLNTVIFENGSLLKTIGQKAFRTNKIEKLQLPNGLETISDYAFCDNKLTSIRLPDSLKSIGENAFCDNKLTSIRLPDKLRTWIT